MKSFFKTKSQIKIILWPFLLFICINVVHFGIIHDNSCIDFDDDHSIGDGAEQKKEIKRDQSTFRKVAMSTFVKDRYKNSRVEFISPRDETVNDHASRIIHDKFIKESGDRSPARVNNHFEGIVDESILDAFVGNSMISQEPSWSIKKTPKNPSEHLRRVNVSASLRQLGPEVFDAFPESFTPLFRNPCWGLDSNHQPSYCLPYFFLAGMPKCGTSDLWDKLINHHHIVTTSFKELHWWTRRRLANPEMLTYGTKPDPRSYYRRFAHEIVKYGRRNGEDIHKIIAGDGSASTLWDNQHWKNVYDPRSPNGPPHVNSELIKAVQPDARAIVILRDPTERLYSDYMYFVDKSKTPAEFHLRVRKAVYEFQRCVRRDGLRKCTYSTSSLNRSVRLEVGVYAVYIRDWLKSFPRSRLKVIRLESWKVNCTSELAGLYAFLELEPVSYAELGRICGGEAKNTRTLEKSSLGSMLPETRLILDQFYSRYNRDLARILRDDRFLWSAYHSEIETKSV